MWNSFQFSAKSHRQKVFLANSESDKKLFYFQAFSIKHLSSKLTSTQGIDEECYFNKFLRFQHFSCTESSKNIFLWFHKFPGPAKQEGKENHSQLFFSSYWFVWGRGNKQKAAFHSPNFYCWIFRSKTLMIPPKFSLHFHTTKKLKSLSGKLSIKANSSASKN